MHQNLLINSRVGKNNLDLIRFILATAVIFCHSFVIYYGNGVFNKTEPLLILSQEQISIGSLAVDFFFIISGFLIVRSFESSKTNGEYLQKRVIRIFPGFIIAFLFSVLIVGFVGQLRHVGFSGYFDYLQSLHKKRELIHLLTLQSPSNDYSYFKSQPLVGLNTSLWTIQFEFICYLLVPVIALLGFFKKKWLFLTAFLVSYTVLFLQLQGYILPYIKSYNVFIGNPYFFPRFLTYFFAGACFYNYRSKIIKSEWMAMLAFTLLISSFIWIKCVDQVLPIAGSYLLFYIAYHPNLQFSEFSKKGDYSYGLYLYAWPLQQLTMHFLQPYLNPFRLFFIATPATLIFAYLSWHFIEKRFLSLKGKTTVPVIPERPFSIIFGTAK